jgi:hypothetical protein
VAQLARAHLGQMAAKLGVDPHTMHIALEAAVREHLQELGEMRPSGLMDMDYEGAAEIERAWREGLTPDPLLTVSEWSDRHRMLSSKASAEPGAGAPAARRT